MLHGKLDDYISPESSTFSVIEKGYGNDFRALFLVSEKYARK